MKLKMKEWMVKVNEWMKRNETSSSAWSTGQYTDFEFRRKGNTVSVASRGIVPATADSAVFANIPVGYRPNGNFDFTVWGTNGTRLGILRFTTDGKIYPVFGALTSGALRQTLTYIVGGGTA